MTPYSSRVASKESTVNFTSAVPHIYTHRKGFFHSHAKKEREIIWSCPVPRFCWKVGRSVWLLDNEFKGDINCFQEARFFFCIRERVIYTPNFHIYPKMASISLFLLLSFFCDMQNIFRWKKDAKNAFKICSAELFLLFINFLANNSINLRNKTTLHLDNLLPEYFFIS